MKTMSLAVLICAFAGSPAESGSIPQQQQEEEVRDFWVFDGVNLSDLTLLVQRKTGRRMMWTEDLGLRNKRIFFSLEKAERDSEKIFRIYQSFLSMNDLVLVPIRGVDEGKTYYKIQLASMAPKRALPVVDGTEKLEDRFVSRVFHLKYVSPRDVHVALINMVTFPQGILPIESAGTLILSDYDYNIRRLAQIIAAMDRPESGEQMEVIPLENRKVGEIHPLLEELFVHPEENPDSRSKKAGSPVIRILPDEGTNSLVVRANRAWLEKIRRVVERLDRKKK